MDALTQRPPAQAIAAMQAINRIVLNPLFLPIFVGLAPLSLLTAALAFAAWPLRPALWLAAAGLLYCAGTFAVTVVRSVPMNDALARVDAGGADAAAQWTGYLSHWTRWNQVRSLSAVAALACALMGLRD
ncbi:anthrone oxygenase family protein [Lysobacter enzymogenes]|uniref:anthrone oxygenase family protein n=1 Tax=Lysobacter enzymogenes TaxID=69 RepID=UPI00384A9CAA